MAITSERTADATYTLGRTEAETVRLIKQSRLYDRSTRRLLEDAGVSAGMKVLDLGSGAGDVAFIAADLVGPTGAVVGVDSNPAVLQTARGRAAATGMEQVRFIEGDIRTVALPDDFDAVVGRLVMVYVGDPVEAVRVAASHVRPGGIVAFQDLDFAMPYAYASAGHLSPLMRQLWTWIIDVFRQSGAHVTMGMELHRTFLEAGLGAPEMALYAPIGGPEDWPGFDYIADSLCSLLPLLERFGIATPQQVDADTLAARVCEEVARTDIPVLLTPLVSAWVRKGYA